jgi:homocysteine S-methyltransferase
MDILAQLQTRVLTGDGATGTLLMERSVSRERCFEELNLVKPDLIRSVHHEYLAAGAQLLETNSFGANRHLLARHGLESQVERINLTAATLAREAAGTRAWIAGSIGPLGLPSGAETAEAEGFFAEQISALLEGGVDLLFLETFSAFAEMQMALRVAKRLSHRPVICSFASTPEGALAGGMPLADAFHRLLSEGADIVGLNCGHGPQAMLRIVSALPADLPLAVFANAGYPRFSEGRFQYDTTPEYFARIGAELARQGAKLIGGCCGTTPSHIAALSEALKPLKPVWEKAAPRAEPVTSRVKASSGEPVSPAPASEQPAAPSLLEKLAEGKTVIVTELDTPKTLDLDAYYAGARALTEAGSDAITLADNSLAILRVSNLAVGAALHQRGITPLLHIACRDKNILGLQSELLGLAALGIHHILPLTGDPAKVGDHPGATSVYDVTSIELLRIVQQMNQGVNANGKSIKQPTRFCAGCTFNPNARNLDAQLSRLERKLAAGATYVLTQPVFDAARMRLLAERTASFGVPVFPGIWPLLNGRQADFLHNEVPGILIPDEVRERMRGAEGPEGQALGIQIAKEMCEEALQHFRSIYLITPFLRYETTVELARFVRSKS